MSMQDTAHTQNTTSPRYAILVVDMLNDFITGSLACERAQRIIAPMERLLDGARANGVPVVYCNDNHLPGVDHELKLWGEHAMSGTAGAAVIDELAPQGSDYVVPKRRYSGFFQTNLAILLRELDVDTLVVAGVHTHMCVRHTAADGYQWGYDIVAPTDGLEAFTVEDHESGLAYLESTYGARLTDCDTLVAEFAAV